MTKDFNDLFFNEFLLLAIIHFLVVAPGPDFAVVVQQKYFLR